MTLSELKLCNLNRRAEGGATEIKETAKNSQICFFIKQFTMKVRNILQSAMSATLSFSLLDGLDLFPVFLGVS